MGLQSIDANLRENEPQTSPFLDPQMTRGMLDGMGGMLRH